MNVVKTTKVEDCFDGSMIMRYCFDSPWERPRILRLAELGALDFFPEFPRPFFRLRGAEGFEIKGVEGDCDCQIMFPRQGKEVCQELIISWIRQCNADEHEGEKYGAEASQTI